MSGENVSVCACLCFVCMYDGVSVSELVSESVLVCEFVCVFE